MMDNRCAGWRKWLAAALLLAALTIGCVMTGTAESETEGTPAVSETVQEPVWIMEGPFQMETLKKFQLPVPEGWTVQWSRAKDRMRAFDQGESYLVQAFVTEMNGAFFARETWNDRYTELLDQLQAELYLPVSVGAEELALLLPQAMETETGDMQSDHWLRLVYGHANHLLVVDVVSFANPLGTTSINQMLPQIAYLSEEEEAAYGDYQLVVLTPGDKTDFSAGEKVELTVSFANAETVNARQGNNGVAWYVMAREEEKNGLFSISQKGVLTISKEITEPTDFAVVVSSQVAGTRSYLEMRALPQIQELTLDQTEATLYLGQSDTAELQISVQPETATREVEWLTSAKGTATVAPGENGKATVRAVNPGTAMITARDPISGKRAQAQVTVIRPVTELIITGSDQLSPKQKAYYHAEAVPANASNKLVKWSIDVDSDVAEIGRDGGLQVKRGAVPGTEITITCEALGSSNGLKAQFVVTITE